MPQAYVKIVFVIFCKKISLNLGLYGIVSFIPKNSSPENPEEIGIIT